MIDIETLRGVITVTSEEISGQVKQMVSEIKENGQENGRSTEQLVNNVVSGVILETAFAKATGGVINRRRFNPADPKTFAYDVSIGDTTFEIKPTRENDTWFNFNVKGTYNPSDHQLTRADLTTYLKYKDWVDWVVVGFYNTVSSGQWEVQFKWVIDSGTFEDYMKKSNAQQSGTTHYYDVKSSTRRGSCIDLRFF